MPLAMNPRSSTPPGEDVASRVLHESSQATAIFRLEDGTILEATDAFGSLLDRDAKELVGTTTTALGLFFEIGDEQALRLLRERGAIDEFDARVSLPSGEERTVRLWAELVPGDEPLVVVRAHRGAGAAAGLGANRTRENEMRYRALVEQAAALIYVEVTDDSRASGSRATYVSPYSIELLGYTPDELVEDPTLWDDIVHPDDRDRVFAETNAVELNGRPFQQQYRVVRKDGQVRWVRDDATLIEDPASRIRVWQGFMLDITEAETKYRTLVEAIPAITYIDIASDTNNSPTLYISPQVKPILGYSPQEWMADPDLWMSLLHPDDRERVLEADRSCFGTTTRLSLEYRLIARDGRVVWFEDESTIFVDEDGTPRLEQGVMLDITARKQAEEELAHALERLRALDRLKNTLLHTLSHDLRSPLTAILGAASTLERLDTKLPKDERAHLLHTLAARARGMNTLLTDLLDLDRLDQGIVEPKRFPVDLGELAQEVILRTDALDGREVDLDAGRVPLAVDAPKVERMLENLLSNAVRHTPPDSHIWVRVAAEDGGAILIVEDDGPGVPDDMKEVIFEAFQRGPKAAETPGTGIGLSLVARFAELHGGRTWVEDRPGGGASFRIFLPGTPSAINGLLPDADHLR